MMDRLTFTKRNGQWTMDMHYRNGSHTVTSSWIIPLLQRAIEYIEEDEQHKEGQ
jgi:hypothetical protein